MQHTTEVGEDHYGKRRPVSTTDSWLVVINKSPNHTLEKMPHGVWIRRWIEEPFRHKSALYTTGIIAEITKKGEEKADNSLMASVLGLAHPPPYNNKERKK